MINTLKLQGRIVEKGFSNTTLAPKVNCSAYTLGQKILNKSPMNLEDAIILSQILDINKDEFAEFFLNKKL